MVMNSYEDQIDFAQVPVLALGHPGRHILSRSLNPLKVLPSEDGLPRDWRGIAHLAGLQGLYGPSINADADAMKKVLMLWCRDGDNETASFDNLVKFLGAIDRWDVADDLAEALAEDAKAYLSRKRRNQQLVLQQDAVAETDTSAADYHRDEMNFLTKDDLLRAQEGLPLQTYDAFVLFADEDIDYATELVERLEMDHPKYGFKLCVKDRDLIGGIQFEHEAVMRLIRERCSRLIAIVTRAFLSSPEKKFFVNYAQALQIELNCRKIIPCFYDKKEECKLPEPLRYYFSLSYLQSGKLYNFWDKLSDAIRPVNGMANGSFARPSIQITEIEDTPRPAAIEAPPVATVNHVKTTKVSAAKPKKVHLKPEPKIRNAFSVSNLLGKQPNVCTATTSDLTSSNCDKNRSETNLSNISSSSSFSKFYKRIFQKKKKKKQKEVATI